MHSEEVQEEYDEERKGIARSWNYFDQHEEQEGSEETVSVSDCHSIDISSPVHP